MPTTALDVIVRDSLLKQMRRFQTEDIFVRPIHPSQQAAGYLV